jgi:Amt family ammonium transporter
MEGPPPTAWHLDSWQGWSRSLPPAALFRRGQPSSSAGLRAAVLLMGRLGYDDSLDAFGVHGIGGFLGAVLTGIFCSLAFNE